MLAGRTSVNKQPAAGSEQLPEVPITAHVRCLDTCVHHGRQNWSNVLVVSSTRTGVNRVSESSRFVLRCFLSVNESSLLS